MEKGDGHYVQNNRLVVGRNIYQKPMPKQDKGGGIFPTAEGARIVLTSSGAAKCRPAACSVPSIARYKHAGNPRLGEGTEMRRNNLL